MSNIKNYNFNNIDLILNNSEYYDFYLVEDKGEDDVIFTGLNDSCSISYFDFNDTATFNNTNQYDRIYSIDYWSGSTNTGLTLNYFGFTGIDNGFITFNKTSGDTCNTALTQTLTGSVITIPSGDTRLFLTRVTGATGNYIYPIDYINNTGSTGSYVNLCGGWYQGFYKLEQYPYQVLPDRYSFGWTVEFWLNKNDVCSGYTGTTLNDIYPDNKGIFFYLGTRAENKFWNIFNGLNTGCTSGCCNISTACTITPTEFCTPKKEINYNFINSDGLPIFLSPIKTILRKIYNKFLIYGSANNKTGLGSKNACAFTGDHITLTAITKERKFDTNPFLLYGRANENSICGCNSKSSGLGNRTTCDDENEEIKSIYDIKDPNIDIIDNVLAFRIKDDGSIGYRMLTITGDCVDDIYVTGVTKDEEYSESGTVIDNQWQHIAIKFQYDIGYDEDELDCAPLRSGELKFYVNGNLVFTSKKISEIIFKGVNEYKEKQLGVPYNISIGGGSQGLIENMTFDGPDPNDIGLPIEKYFAGSFIGSISQFRLHNCPLNYPSIRSNYEYDKKRYEII